MRCRAAPTLSWCRAELGKEAKFATWLLSREDEFYGSEGLWQALVQELEITNQQTRMLLTRRESLKELEAKSQRLYDLSCPVHIVPKMILLSPQKRSYRRDSNFHSRDVIFSKPAIEMHCRRDEPGSSGAYLRLGESADMVHGAFVEVCSHCSSHHFHLTLTDGPVPSVFGKFLQTALDDLPQDAVEELLASL